MYFGEIAFPRGFRKRTGYEASVNSDFGLTSTKFESELSFLNWALSNVEKNQWHGVFHRV